MVESSSASRTPDAARPGDGRPQEAPGIAWEPGEEDYPFAALPGESALSYFERWLREAPYARLEQGGSRYLHEVDVINVVNHITADVGLLRGRLEAFGDQVVTAADFTAIVQRIEGAIALLRDARMDLQRGPDSPPSGEP